MTGSSALSGGSAWFHNGRMKSWRLLGGMAVVASVLVVAPTAAQEQPDGAVLLILDASGSMNRVDDNGVVLIEGAQQALTGLVEVLPEGAAVGLRVYGHRVPNDDKANGCQDTELIVPVSPLDRAAMTEAINSFGAKGFTPIGLSLQEAASDLPGGRGTVVLVSDGEDTCAPPDPCQVARDLIASGINIEVQTVGFFLGDDVAARAQLQCIADETGGSYREVSGVDTLAAELGSIVRNVLPGVGHITLPITGSLEIATATLLPMGPPFGSDVGWHEYIGSQGGFDTRVGAGEIRWFALEVAEGLGLDVAADVYLQEAPAPGESFEVLILDSSLDDARRPAPRRGPQIVDLNQYVRESGLGEFIVVAAGNHTDFQPYSDLVQEPEQLVTLERQGYDEATYNSEALARGLAPIEAPIEGGTYYIGLSWDSDRPAAQVNVGFGAFVTRRPADLYGQVYQHVTGGLEAGTAGALTDPADMSWDAYGLPPADYPFQRAFYVGEINSGETRWYRQPVEADEALAVAATLQRAVASQLLGDSGEDDVQYSNEGEFSVQIYDEDLDPIGGEYRSTMQAPIDDESPSPGVGVSMAFSGEGEIPPSIQGEVYLAITWTSPTEEAAEVQFIADIIPRYPDGVYAPTPLPEPPDSGPEPQAAEDSTGGATAVKWLSFAGTVTLLLVAGGWLLLRRRRRT